RAASGRGGCSASCSTPSRPTSRCPRGRSTGSSTSCTLPRPMPATRRAAPGTRWAASVHRRSEYLVEHIRAALAARGPHHLGLAVQADEEEVRLRGPIDSEAQRTDILAVVRSLPGTAAEILDDEVRQVLCPDKIDTAEWLEAHRIAHSVGLRSNVTIMFGAIEQPRSWARHLVATRDLQKETGGFTEFVGLPFVHMATPLYLQRRSRRGPTFREVLLMHAVARIAYHGWIDHVQASWVKIGLDGVRQLLRAGVDDLGGTLMDENISRAAG